MIRALHSFSRAAATLLILAAAGTAEAASCRSENFEGAAYTACRFNPAGDELQVFWRNGEGEPYRTFGALAKDLQRQGRTLRFAMNGGMYQKDLSPVGLMVENGEQRHPLNRLDPPQTGGNIPNFFKKPNGVFYLTPGGAGVLTTDTYAERRPEATFATQSGPMLVISGELHPMFIPGSSDRKPRNGVGSCGPDRVEFAISEDRVNFHDFARFFRDHLGCPDALFLDGGSASGLYAPELGRDDPPGHGGYGPIIAAVE